MVDTVNYTLSKYDARGIDFLAETPCFLDRVSEHYYLDGGVILIGWLDSLKVRVSECQVKVCEGSICKWHLGNNYQAMTRGDVQCAVEALSDALHLPMGKARITRLDVAHNIITQHPTDVYLNHLGELRYAHRLQQPHSLYYQSGGRTFCLYDKNREQRAKHETIPELYQGRNVLRIEQRYTQRLSKQFKVEAVTGAMLYDEKFYIGVGQRWLKTYKDIIKINDITINFKNMKTKKDFQMMGLTLIVEQLGGEVALINHLKEAQRSGELTAKQAYDLRQMFRTACNRNSVFTVKSEAITELDKKVAEAVRYYR